MEGTKNCFDVFSLRYDTWYFKGNSGHKGGRVMAGGEVQASGQNIKFFWFSNLILYSMQKMESYACSHCLLSLREQMALVL